MKIHIQGPSGLIELSPEVTSETIIDALGYTPANQVDIDNAFKSDSDTFYVVDKDGNIISKIDKDGITTTTINANTAKFETLEVTDIITNTDEFVLTDTNGNVVAKIDKDGLLIKDINATNIVSTNITTDTLEVNDIIADTDNFTITDNSGNTAFKVDKDGVNTGRLMVNNVDVSLDGHTHELSEITDFKHTHEINEVNGLQGALDDKLDEVSETDSFVIIDNDGNKALEINELGVNIGKLSVSSDLTVSGTLGVMEKGVFDGDLSVWGTADFYSDLFVAGTAEFDNDLTVSGTLGVTGNATIGTLNVTNSATIGTLDVNGKGNFDSDLSVSGALGVMGNGSFNNDLIVGGTLEVTDISTNSENFVITDNDGLIALKIDDDGVGIGKLFIENDLSVVGELGVSGNATIGGTLSVNKGATFNCDLAVNGNLGVTGTANIGTLVVNNTATVGTLEVTNSATIGTLYVTEEATFESNLSVSGTLGVSGTGTFGSNLSVSGTLGVHDKADLYDDLFVGGTLEVTKDAVFNNDLTVNNTATVETLNAGNSNIGTLGVTGTATISGCLGVAGTGDFNSDLNILGILGVTDIDASSNNFVIRDNTGLIALKIDDEGVDTGRLMVNGDDVATEKYVDEKVTGLFDFKGTIGTTGADVQTLPNSHEVGDSYRVITAGTYTSHKCEVGDMIVCIKNGSTNNTSDWTVLQQNWEAIGGTENLAWNTSVTLATIGGLAIKAKMPPEYIPGDNIDINNLIITAKGYTWDDETSTMAVTGKIEATEGFYETSDARKKDVQGELPLDKAYDFIRNCEPILYNLKGSDKTQIGLIAQEVREFFPEIVNEDEEGYLSLDYAKLTVIILRVLKDLIDKK